MLSGLVSGEASLPGLQTAAWGWWGGGKEGAAVGRGRELSLLLRAPSLLPGLPAVGP